MKTLHFYLLRQVIASLLMTVVVFTFVLLLGNVLKDVLGLLVNRQASVGAVLQAVGLLIPFVWVFALPMGMLTATLLVFGRFSADQELTAARAGGISLISLATPILILSLLLSGISAWVNLDLGPRSREAFKDLIFRYTADISNAQVPEGRYIRDFPGYMFYVGKNRNGALEDIVVYFLNTGTNPPTTIIAPRGRLDLDISNRVISLQLFDAKGVSFQGDHAAMISGDVTHEFKLTGFDRARNRTSISDMSFMELRAEFREIEKHLSAPLTLTNSAHETVAAKRQAIENQLKDPTSRVRVQMHRQVAFSFACFGFTLIGIPLGIRMHRRETNVGFAIAIMLVLVYYGFIMIALSLDQQPEWSPHLILWLPNFIFQVVGAVLLLRANRGL